MQKCGDLGRASLQLVLRHPFVLREHCNNKRGRGLLQYMESFLRDLREARDACNKLPFDDALRDKIATELDRIEAALRLSSACRFARVS